MKTIEQLKAEHEKQLADLQRQIVIAESMPIEPDNVYTFGKLYPSVSYKVKSIADVIHIFESMPCILPMIHAKKSCTIVAHAGEFPEYTEDTWRGQYCLKIEVSQGSGYGPSVKFCFYTETGAGKLKVICDLQGASYKYSANIHKLTSYYKQTEYMKSANTLLSSLCDNVIMFYSGGPNEPQANFTYCFVADNEDCTAFAHLIGQLQCIE